MNARLAALCAAGLLAGCAGSLFKTAIAPPTLYLLSAQPAEQGATAAALPVDLAILKPRVRAGLDTDRIAALYPDRHLDYFADARWSGPLDEVVQDLAMQVFHSRAGMRTIGGDSSAFSSLYWLEITVVDFEAEYASAAAAPVVHVHLQARVGSAADRRVLANFDAEVRQAATDNRLRAIVQAYNQAANEAVAELAARTSAALAAESKPR
jgi:cholesterol transport system auxiliary component